MQRIKAIYDNDGKTVDRYTVYFNDGYTDLDTGKYFNDCLGMSSNPYSPQGFSQHSSGLLGRHNGRRIKLEELPTECLRVLKQFDYI